MKQSTNVFKENFENEDYGYIGNIKTFVDFFENNDKVKFDCISILNFLHGNEHFSEEIEKLFNLFPKICNYIYISEPKWENLNIRKYTDDYIMLEKLNNSAVDHILYKVI